ncbi:hypothetical protein BCV69DRAFT_284471 [Microstroma glucosiphilum]|uniref:SET domain-containing protein n=1 Tax=Pseudomicrostroma glucosiphilum TaxID=1684307 RepID=A0A316U3C7_9BASI|nr:hypothetical protein BCV69DRAFT_284471 [Pseudomicrostroma glucosiphilum]PWN19328.1 hypothetical protein BCV69DRAFT_284471 [Pseudomicrostroma glucosiphilum]
MEASALLSLWAKHAGPPSQGAGNAKKPRVQHVAQVEISDELKSGRGLVLARTVKPGEVILTIPPSMLYNTATIRVFFQNAAEVLPTSRRPSDSISSPSSELDAALPLTSVRALSILLASFAMYKASGEPEPSTWSTAQTEALTDLNVFYASLPTAFPTHPLIWTLLAEGDTQSARNYSALLRHLPRSCRSKLEEVVLQFQSDWTVVNAIFLHRPDLLPFFHPSPSGIACSKMAYAHAWLSINTRSVYYPLNLQPHSDNLTLAPLLDMANHTSDESSIFKVAILGIHHGAAKVPVILPPGAGGLEIRAPSGADTQLLATGSEVRIQYGARDDGVLLAEYGFHLSNTAASSLSPATLIGNPYASLSLDKYVAEYMSTLDPGEAKEKQDSLIEAGYYGDWTIHPYPTPIASWRTVVALRLLVLVKGNADTQQEQQEQQQQLQRWKLLVEGRISSISQENDVAARRLLLRLCEAAQVDLQRTKCSLQAELRSGSGSDSDGDSVISTGEQVEDGPAWRESLGLVTSLLECEMEVCRRVREVAGSGTPW